MFKLLKNCCLFIGIWLWTLTLAAPVAHAITKTFTATVSATATVGATTPTTGDTIAPSNPILIKPVDGTMSGDNHPEFVWRGSIDSNSNTVIYTLYLNGVATYLGISNLGNSAGSNYTARLDGNEIKLLPTIPLADGIYSWYVTASDLSGNTSSSTTWHLTIDTVAPPLTLTDLDSFHNPVITEGANFDITGPKDIYFTVSSDPFTTIQITLSTSNSTVYTIQSTTLSSGLTSLYQHLQVGVYAVSILATDQAGNTTLLPTFTLTITQAALTITLPGQPPYSIPYTPYSIPTLPATIAKLQTRDYLSVILLSLLTAIIFGLLIFLYRRRYNLILLDSHFRPIHHATIYHSTPRPHPLYSILHTTYYKSYIPHLSRYSTLTIRLNQSGAKHNSLTYILSISVKQRLYTIILG